ncbi:hypothetical protein [Cronobacter dublinensis]|uniref:hypothetical protein n=1 Tax=Cronobacter dublinensis TaxID=413497 RepID=UPI00137563D0|nr:hypothetical protein [Cronobacter dublinensis]
MRWNISEIARRRQPMPVAYRFDIHWKYRQKGRRLSHLARLFPALTDRRCLAPCPGKPRGVKKPEQRFDHDHISAIYRMTAK